MIVSLPVVCPIYTQLSFNLGSETSLKLDWLKQISLVFNPQAPEIAGFVRDVLGPLQSNLDAAAAEVVALGDQECIKDFKFVQRTVARFSR